MRILNHQIARTDTAKTEAAVALINRWPSKACITDTTRRKANTMNMRSPADGLSKNESPLIDRGGIVGTFEGTPGMES